MESLQGQREAIISTQVDAENRHDIAAVIASFAHPCYEVIPLSVVADSVEAVNFLFQRLFSSFPNLYSENFLFYHSDEAVIVEGRLIGTQLGTWVDLPATGRVMNVPFVALFIFDEERLIRKRIYFDNGTVTRQLLGSE